ncbi:hypothetical protein AB9P05_12955 [Roseivirga sp. BDSF3-8]|uniref:hypothetical protein n=1 Tax=Roseivirga sp. BDSF3-8 TaxID=3241598 RepID=UPI0035320862
MKAITSTIRPTHKKGLLIKSIKFSLKALSVALIPMYVLLIPGVFLADLGSAMKWVVVAQLVISGLIVFAAMTGMRYVMSVNSELWINASGIGQKMLWYTKFVGWDDLLIKESKDGDLLLKDKSVNKFTRILIKGKYDVQVYSEYADYNQIKAIILKGQTAVGEYLTEKAMSW